MGAGAEAEAVEKRSRSGRIWYQVAPTVVIGSIGSVVLLTAGGCGAATGTLSDSSDPSTPAGAYQSALNSLVTGEVPDITQQNNVSLNPDAAATAINDRIRLFQQFDAAVHAISVPDSAQADVKQLLSADAGLEQALSTLSVNVNDVRLYNNVFPTVLSAENAFHSANAAVSNDLGLTPP